MTHHKRPFSASTIQNPCSSSSSMKKAKSQQSSGEKNGVHSHHQDLFDSSSADDEFVAATTGVAANLSRKKAVPPQPTDATAARKQLKIKLNKGAPPLPTNFEENTWALLKSAITAIFLKKPDSCDLEKLYQAVTNLCDHKMGGNLYQRIQLECEGHISTALSSLVGQSPDLVVFLSLVEKCWQDFSDQMLLIRSIALFLDRTYVKQNQNILSLWDMGLQLFRKHLSLSPEVENKTITGLLRLIERERLGEAIDRTLLNHLLKMFTALGIYVQSFEKPFL